MKFFSDKNLDERTKLTRRKSMLNLRFVASAYVVFLAYRLFTSSDEATAEIPSIIVTLAPLALFAGAVFIAILTYKERKRLDKQIEELDAKKTDEETDEDESSIDNSP